MSSLIWSLPTNIQDTSHALHHFKKFQYHSFIFAMVISHFSPTFPIRKSSVSCISPKNQNITSSSQLISSSAWQNSSSPLTTFLLISSHFLQVKGVDMGTRMGAPVMPDILLFMLNAPCSKCTPALLPNSFSATSTVTSGLPPATWWMEEPEGPVFELHESMTLCV